MYFIQGCYFKNEKVIKPIPLVSIENFEKDTAEVILIFGRRVDKLEFLSEDEYKIVENYYNNYEGNLKLAEDQLNKMLSIEMVKVFYTSYEANQMDSDSDSIERANESIENTFNVLKRLEREGYQIK